MISRSFITEAISSWKHLGYQRFPNGTELVGHVPHVAPEAWFHKVYAAKESFDVRKYYGGEVNRINEYSYFDIFNEFNGINLFSGAFYLFGNRENYNRDWKVAIAQPWDFSNGLHSNEEYGIPEYAIIIGGSHSLPDGIYFFETIGGNISAVDRSIPGKIMYKWPNMENFLNREISRLCKIFDADGRPTDSLSLSRFDL